jgi:type IV pilus assembly protein PilV
VIKRKKYSLFNQKGFNLIETLVGMAILSVGMLGAASLVINTIQANRISRELTTATILAQDKMEDLLHQGYEKIPATDETITEDYGDISEYPNHKRIVRVDVDTPVAGMKTVTVESYWKTGSQPVILNALVTK